MAINRLFSALTAAVLACCLAVGASAEVASPDSAAVSGDADSIAVSAVQPETTSAPDLSDTALSEDTRYSASEVAEILKEHPNAFTAAADPDDTANSDAQPGEDGSTQTAGDSTQTVADSGTIWDKPFNDYTPTEGYLLILFVLAVSVLAFQLARFVWL